MPMFPVLSVRLLCGRAPVRTKIFVLPLGFFRAFAARTRRPPERTYGRRIGRGAALHGGVALRPMAADGDADQ